MYYIPVFCASKISLFFHFSSINFLNITIFFSTYLFLTKRWLYQKTDTAISYPNDQLFASRDTQLEVIIIFNNLVFFHSIRTTACITYTTILSIKMECNESILLQFPHVLS